MLLREKDPRAFAGIAKCCDAKTDKIRNALVEFLKREDICYLGRSAALNMLGSQRNDVDTKYLVQFCKDQKDPGHHGIIRNGALAGLGESRDIEAFKFYFFNPAIY